MTNYLYKELTQTRIKHQEIKLPTNLNTVQKAALFEVGNMIVDAINLANSLSVPADNMEDALNRSNELDNLLALCEQIEKSLSDYGLGADYGISRKKDETSVHALEFGTRTLTGLFIEVFHVDAKEGEPA